MLKFIKMEYHDAYLLYYSVLFAFFMFEIFYQRWWKLRQESHALASK